jgi:hypothetical protein
MKRLKPRWLANDLLSPVVLKALKEFVAAKEAEARGFDRVQVEFEDSDDKRLPKIKAFHGKWIFSPSVPLEMWNEEGTEGDVHCVAVTAKGNVVVYMWQNRWAERQHYTSNRRFLVFPSFGDADRDDTVNYAIRQAIKKRGVPVEELDI